MEWSIPRISDDPLQLTHDDCDRIFIVGANGSGKSALIQHFVSSNQNKRVRRISAHRQTWLHSGSIDITPQGRKQFDRYDTNRAMQPAARWQDDDPHTRHSAVLFDLVAKENARARLIARHVDGKNMQKAEQTSAESSSPFEQLNELLRVGTLAVTIKNSNDEEVLAKHQKGDGYFSIAQMSDGERNTVIIAAEVLTVESGTVLLIDEPERHLHRSIIEPFLSALFERRSDCAFVVSTHEIALPIANPEARVLMVRSCQWSGDTAKAWDVELLEPNNDLPEELKRDILGSRKRILFVEGSDSSLDLPLYNALFPGLSVVPKEGCKDVERAVKGLRESQGLHHVEAFGLIDRDTRDDDEVKQLAENRVFALDVCSAESLYYCSGAIAAVARRQAESLGCNAEDMIESAIRKALATLTQDDLAERMAARLCENKLRSSMLSQIPDYKKIKEHNSPKIEVSIESPFPRELERFKKLVNDKRLDDLVARYPLRESGMFGAIATVLECRPKKNYERMVVSSIRNDAKLALKLKQRIGPLVRALEAESMMSEGTG